MGAVCCLPWAGTLVGELGAAPAGSIAGMVYLGAVPTALAFSTWAYALRRMDAGKLGVTTYVVPPLVILLGWLLLDEVPPALARRGRRRLPRRRRPSPGAARRRRGRRCPCRRRPAPPSEPAPVSGRRMG